MLDRVLKNLTVVGLVFFLLAVTATGVVTLFGSSKFGALPLDPDQLAGTPRVRHARDAGRVDAGVLDAGSP